MVNSESHLSTSFLHTENIARSTEEVEYHPLRPFLPENCKVLFLGSFPPQRKRWCMDFYYPNFINDHWRIEGLIFFGDKDYFVDNVNKTFRLERIIPFLEEQGRGRHKDDRAAVIGERGKAHAYLRKGFVKEHPACAHGDTGSGDEQSGTLFAQDSERLPCRKDDDASICLEAIHLGEQLVEGLLPLVIAADFAAIALLADRIDLIDKDNTRRLLARLLE